MVVEGRRIPDKAVWGRYIHVGYRKAGKVLARFIEN